MYPYEVVYLESSILEKNSKHLRKGNLDGLSTSKELEALLIEKKKDGFELHNLTPLNGVVVASPYSINTTIGFLVTFKRIEK